MNDAPAHVSSGESLMALLREAKSLAARYYALTHRPLGVTGEVAEFEAVRLLKMHPAKARQAGYDATRQRGDIVEKLQIKGRCVQGKGSSQRIGSIKLTHEWDFVLLVLMDATFNATEIWEADRSSVVIALTAPGSKARNERGALSVGKFKSISHKVWPPANP